MNSYQLTGYNMKISQCDNSLMTIQMVGDNCRGELHSPETKINNPGVCNTLLRSREEMKEKISKRVSLLLLL